MWRERQTSDVFLLTIAENKHTKNVFVCVCIKDSLDELNSSGYKSFYNVKVYRSVFKAGRHTHTHTSMSTFWPTKPENRWLNCCTKTFNLRFSLIELGSFFTPLAGPKKEKWNKMNLLSDFRFVHQFFIDFFFYFILHI